MPWLRVINITGPTVEVVGWSGAHPVRVATGTTKVVFPVASAPSPPWHVTVRAEPDLRVLLDVNLTKQHGIQAITVRGSNAEIHETRAPTGSC